MEDWSFVCTECPHRVKSGLGPVSAQARATSHGIRTGHTVLVLMNGDVVDEVRPDRISATLDDVPPF